MNTLQIVEEKARKYHIPTKILWGVYGAETGHGSNVSTSSGGAKGAFQFIEPTAASYHYPWTNEQNEQIFNAQADAAAHYLADELHHTGSWEGAIQAYSGHSYSLAHVIANAGGLSGSSFAPEGTSSTTTGSAGGSTSPSSTPSSGLTSEGLLGIGVKALLYLALLAGGALLVWYGTHAALRPRKPQ